MTLAVALGIFPEYTVDVKGRVDKVPITIHDSAMTLFTFEP